MDAIRNGLAALVLAMAASLATAADTVDINSADAQTLARELQGIGPAKAAAIVEFRERHGAFISADGLAEISGISSRIVELNRARIVVGKGD